MIINILLSLIVATFNAFKQYKIKRFLIFSSMTHIGYILLGITTGTIEGIQSIFVYFIIYVISILNVWGIYIYFNIYDKPTFCTLFNSFYTIITE